MSASGAPEFAHPPHPPAHPIYKKATLVDKDVRRSLACHCAAPTCPPEDPRCRDRYPAAVEAWKRGGAAAAQAVAAPVAHESSVCAASTRASESDAVPDEASRRLWHPTCVAHAGHACDSAVHLGDGS